MSDGPHLDVTVPVIVNNTLGWPFDADVERVDVDVFSEDLSDSGPRLYIGQATLDSVTEVSSHSAVSMALKLDVAFRDVLARDDALQERLSRDCKQGQTRLHADVRRLSLQILFGLKMDAPSDVFQPDSFQVDCSALFPDFGSDRHVLGLASHSQAVFV